MASLWTSEELAFWLCSIHFGEVAQNVLEFGWNGSKMDIAVRDRDTFALHVLGLDPSDQPQVIAEWISLGLRCSNNFDESLNVLWKMPTQPRPIPGRVNELLFTHTKILIHAHYPTLRHNAARFRQQQLERAVDLMFGHNKTLINLSAAHSLLEPLVDSHPLPIALLGRLANHLKCAQGARDLFLCAFRNGLLDLAMAGDPVNA